jgi:hypothetical protein
MIQIIWPKRRFIRFAAVALIGGLASACVESRPLYDARFDGNIGSPRWFDPGERCHDAPHDTTSDAVFRGRISIFPNSSCSIRIQPALHSGVTLLGYTVIEEPNLGVVRRTSPLAFTYASPRGGAQSDAFIVRMRYSDRNGRIFQPTISYQVRITPQ